MNAQKKMTKELEIQLIQWLTSEIVKQVKGLTPRGVDGLQFLPEYKVQKLIFLLAEDWNLDITRIWYMYGGYICSPFSLNEYIGNLCEKLVTLPSRAMQSIKEFLGTTLMNDIKLNLKEKCEDVFHRPGDEFLWDFYEEKAPKKFKPVYISFRNVQQYYKNYVKQEKGNDIPRLKLVGYNPWDGPYKFQEYVSEFEVQVAKIVPENVFPVIVEGTKLLEQAIIMITWRWDHEISVTNQDYSNLQRIKKDFENTIWKYIATHFAVASAKGIRAGEIKEQYNQVQQDMINKLPEAINQIKRRMTEWKLVPEAEALETFLESKYSDVINFLEERRMLNEY
ncbi:MAG: hypothetical protein ACTSPV_07290 [Candidatus Hodarchaeales archaeon]